MTRGLLTACLPGLPPAETAGWAAGHGPAPADRGLTVRRNSPPRFQEEPFPCKSR